ncbi:hypothetical protein QT711_17725 [Sporosarcina saromensis]|uniref:Uncharacterized protein n=1 Tax=Sporosarcina saromensis TaxID=359365 RepID=A0ABU4GDD0_9BACL|nr:hypothetical protein [Sporosarcina saromensis]MDW0115003.1 hypothetical protein [Sporosarcina saromensis]
MKKFTYFLFAAMFLFLIGTPSGDAAELKDFKENQKISAEKIDARIAEINSKYDVGEPFSEEDGAFIMKYAMKHAPDETINPMIIYNKVYSATNSLSGVSATISGTCRIDHLVPFVNSYSCDLYARSNKGTVSAILEHTAYGAIGEKAIGIVYSRTHTSNAGQQAANLSAGNNYGAFVAWSYTSVKAQAKGISSLGRLVTVEAIDS